MPIKATLEDGTEIETLSPEEIAAKDAELVKAREEATAAKAEAEKYQKVSAEKTENFKKLNELSEAEKASMSAEKLEAMKRFEAAEARATALETQINNDTKIRIQNDKDSALAKYHGGNEELKKKLEENYAIIGLEGNDIATIQKRAEMAANMLKGSMKGPSPLTAPMNGSAPQSKTQTEKDEFMKSDKAKAALKAMGEKVD